MDFDLFDCMENIKPADTGILDVDMYFTTKDIEGGIHGPRMRISNRLFVFDINDYYALSIGEHPVIEYGVSTLSIEKQQQIEEWIKLNHKILIDFWDGTCDDILDVYKQLKKIQH